MNINLDEAIEESIKMLYGYVPKQGYTRNYFYTTERIKSYLLASKKRNGKAISILGSGDQVLNMASLGINDFDVFDINYLTYFHFYLKRAFILNYGCNEFLEFSQKNFYLYSIKNFAKYLKILEPYLPKDVFLYYQTLVNNLYSKSLICNGLLSLYRNNDIFYNPLNNMYANTFNRYEIAQDSLQDLKIRFHFLDARDLPEKLNDKYDLIILSNVVEYFGTEKELLNYEQFLKYLNSYQKLLNEDGVLINYFYHLDKNYAFPNSNITTHDLNDFPIRLLGTNDGYLLKRNNKKNP